MCQNHMLPARLRFQVFWPGVRVALQPSLSEALSKAPSSWWGSWRPAVPLHCNSLELCVCPLIRPPIFSWVQEGGKTATIFCCISPGFPSLLFPRIPQSLSSQAVCA